jgi:acyl-CoA thioesterase-2
LTGQRCPYMARAWWGEHLLAETAAAVRVDRPDEASELWFPCEDVRFELLRQDDGDASWSVDPALGVPPTTDATRWNTEAGAPIDGNAVLTARNGHATFDHDRVRVELVDAVNGTEARDVTVKRFPTWGDASDLVDILDVRPDGDCSYVGIARGDHWRPVVEGSQMLAQAIVAAGRHAPGRRTVSAHMVFMRPADAGQPLRFDVEELSAGRTFTTLAVHVSQAGRRCASGTFLLDVVAPDVIRHVIEPPATPGPYESEPYDMGVTGRDLRVVDGAYTDDPEAPVGPPVIDAWVRFRDVPDDPVLHTALLVQFTGHMSIAAALRPHEGIGQRAAHRTLSTAINAIAISLHRDVRADQWMLYRHLATFAGDGITHSECRVHDEGGALLASFTVDAMVRRMERDSSAVDDRWAM